MNNIHRVGILLVELVKSSLHLVLVEEGSDRILGAHIVGPYAKEQINIFALAIQRGITSEDLKEIIFAYPTGSSDIAYMLEINNERKPLTLYSWKAISLANE